MVMRLLICAALFLLAGCTSPNAPVAESEGQPNSTGGLPLALSPGAFDAEPRLMVYFNTSYDNFTGAYLGLYEFGLGSLAADWDASADLALPRPMGSLLFEMRCQQTGGFASDMPGYNLRFQVADGDDVLVTMASGDLGDCNERRQYDRADQPRPKGTLTAVEFGSHASELNHEASFDVQFAISWFDADVVPAGHTAFA